MGQRDDALTAGRQAGGSHAAMHPSHVLYCSCPAREAPTRHAPPRANAPCLAPTPSLLLPQIPLPPPPPKPTWLADSGPTLAPLAAPSRPPARMR